MCFQTVRQIYRQTDGHTDRQTDRHTDRKAKILFLNPRHVNLGLKYILFLPYSKSDERDKKNHFTISLFRRSTRKKKQNVKAREVPKVSCPHTIGDSSSKMQKGFFGRLYSPEGWYDPSRMRERDEYSGKLRGDESSWVSCPIKRDTRIKRRVVSSHNVRLVASFLIFSFFFFGLFLTSSYTKDKFHHAGLEFRGPTLYVWRIIVVDGERGRAEVGGRSGVGNGRWWFERGAAAGAINKRVYAGNLNESSGAEAQATINILSNR